jgi:hypothetical protein
VNVTPCLCNKIAWIVEDHFRDVNLKYEVETFDKELLKNPNVEYSTRTYNKIKEIKDEYDKAVKSMIIEYHSKENHKEDKMEVMAFKNSMAQEFLLKCLNVCSDENILCNIMVDICYNNSKKSKQFAWDLCGNIMIGNLLRHRNYKLAYPKQVEQGDFTYKGLQFIMEEIQYEDYCE